MKSPKYMTLICNKNDLFGAAICKNALNIFTNWGTEYTERFLTNLSLWYLKWLIYFGTKIRFYIRHYDDPENKIKMKELMPAFLNQALNSQPHAIKQYYHIKIIILSIIFTTINNRKKKRAYTYLHLPISDSFLKN